MDNHDNGNESTLSDERCTPEDETCEYCEAAIDTSEWYPVNKQRDSDGSLELLPFCSEDCRQQWQDEQTSDD